MEAKYTESKYNTVIMKPWTKMEGNVVDRASWNYDPDYNIMNFPSWQEKKRGRKQVFQLKNGTLYFLV